MTRTSPTNTSVYKRPHPETSRGALQRLATCTGLQNRQPCQVGPIRPPRPPARRVPGDRRGQAHLPTPSKMTSIAASPSRSHRRAFCDPRYYVVQAISCAYVGDDTALICSLLHVFECVRAGQYAYNFHIISVRMCEFIPACGNVHTRLCAHSYGVCVWDNDG